MGRFNDELIRAGVLLAAEGLDDASEGVVVDYSVASRRSSPTGRTARPRNCSAASTSSTCRPRRRPSSGRSARPGTGKGIKTEIRRVPTIDEFPQDNEWIQKERAWREATGQL